MQGKFKQLDVVCFDHKSCVLANKNLNVSNMFLFGPSNVTGQPVQYFCFALPKTFLKAFFVLYLVIIHWLIFLLK